MWSIECVCSSLQSVIVTFFLVIGIMSEEASRAPQGFNSIKVYWSMSTSEHLGLFRSYLPHPNSKSCTISFVGFPTH